MPSEEDSITGSVWSSTDDTVVPVVKDKMIDCTCLVNGHPFNVNTVTLQF